MHVETEAVASSESLLVEVVRSLPPDRLQLLLDELLSILEEPRCSEAQADGAPCTTTSIDCRRCARFGDRLAGLRARLMAEAAL
jgi:hypothetical protein